jgi:hypothetical protein
MKKLILSVAGMMLVFTVAPPKVAATTSPVPAQQESPRKAKIFSGTILKSGEGYVLSDAANKLSYALDDAKKASQYEGKKVKVTGTVDVAANLIHVETIEEIA